MRFRTAAVAALAAGLLIPASGLAQTPSYPEPKDPGKVVVDEANRSRKANGKHGKASARRSGTSSCCSRPTTEHLCTTVVNVGRQRNLY